jgi:hypothetical protein
VSCRYRIGALRLRSYAAKQLCNWVLRESEPSLTKEQAFAKIYTAPENRSLRAAERWANGFHEYAPIEKEAVPVARTDPKILQSMAYGEINALAEEFRRINPFKTNAQLFATATTARPDLLKRERDVSRAALGVEV